MKIALLGGSFDPPHLGHLLIAKQVREFAGIDQIWLMPNYTTSAHAKIFQKNLSPVADRLAMARCLENDFIKVSDFEIHHNQKSITIITLEMLSATYPQHEFYWITGSDKLETFHLYDRWKDIITKHKMIIFPREHMLWHLEGRVKEAFKLQTIPENVMVLQNKDLILTNISSTVVRDRVRKNLSLEHLVPPEVEEYIKTRKLYK